MTDRIPGVPGKCKAVVTGPELQKLQAGEEFAITLRRDDQPIKEGTPYSKAAVLPDELAVRLCPGVEDPAPKDAFASLQSQKADAVRHMTGTSITLRDAAHTPLMGLKIYGYGAEESDAGNTDSITVTVAGKNLLDYRKAVGREGAPNQSVTIDESIHGVYWTGNYYFWIPVSISAGTSVMFSCESECAENPNDRINSFQFEYEDGTTGYYTMGYPAIAEKNVKMLWVRRSISSDYFTMKVWNLQLENGTVTTEYESYKDPQTITIPTPDGLEVSNGIRDEIDCARGVYVKRVGVNGARETPLPDAVLKAYAKLHTYSPTTSITNNAGADMEVIYYTPTTAVQMVRSPADKDKLLSVDEHGCMVLVERDSVTKDATQAVKKLESDMAKVAQNNAWLNDDLTNHLYNDSNPHYVAAEQLGDMADFIMEQDTSGNLKWHRWKSGLAECWGELSVSAEGTPEDTDHCNIFSHLPLYFDHFDSVQVTVLSTNPTDPGDSQYADVLTNLFMSVFNIDAEAEQERLVVRFGVISGGSYNLLNQTVSNVRLSVRVSGTVR